MEIITLNPKGFCDGVVSAFELAEKAFEENEGKKIYLIGSLVHNELAMDSLLKKGFILLNEKDGPLAEQMEGLEDGSVVLYSAHGHDMSSYEDIASRKNFIVYDASCRHVIRNLEKMDEIEGKIAFVSDPNHLEALAAKKKENVRILDPKNSEMGEYDYVISQTSLDKESFEKIERRLREINPSMISLGGRCPSTVLRQENVINAPADADLFVIVGSSSSANTMRLGEIAKASHPNADVIRVLSVNELKSYDLGQYKKAVLASGASSSRTAYEEIESYLRSL